MNREGPDESNAGGEETRGDRSMDSTRRRLSPSATPTQSNMHHEPSFLLQPQPTTGSAATMQPRPLEPQHPNPEDGCAHAPTDGPVRATTEAQLQQSMAQMAFQERVLQMMQNQQAENMALRLELERTRNGRGGSGESDLASLETYKTISLRDAGVSVASIKHQTTEEAANSWYNLQADLRALDLCEIASRGPLIGAGNDHHRGPKAQRDLEAVVQAYVKGDDKVVTSLRSAFAGGGHSTAKLEYVRKNYIEPMEHVEADAERSVTQFDWGAFESKDGKSAREYANLFNAHVSKLPRERRGSESYWIKHFNRNLPTSVLSAMSREREIASSEGRAEPVDTMPRFVTAIGKAIDGERAREANAADARARRYPGYEGESKPGINSGSMQQPQAPPPTLPPQPPPSKPQLACKKCGSMDHRIMDCPELPPCVECHSRMCPKGSYKEAQCDVHGQPLASRIDKMNPQTFARVNERRRDAGKQPLVKTPGVNSISTSPPPPQVEDSMASVLDSRDKEIACLMASLDKLPSV